MKLIEAIVNQLKVNEVRCALDDMGVDDFTESTITCHRPSDGRMKVFRGATFATVVEKVKLEIVAADDSAERIIQAISATSSIGCSKDCRISIRPYLEVT